MSAEPEPTKDEVITVLHDLIHEAASDSELIWLERGLSTDPNYMEEGEALQRARALLARLEGPKTSSEDHHAGPGITL